MNTVERYAMVRFNRAKHNRQPRMMLVCWAAFHRHAAWMRSGWKRAETRHPWWCILGVPRNAGLEAVKSAYRKQVARLGAHENGEKLSRRVNEAYEEAKAELQNPLDLGGPDTW